MRWLVIMPRDLALGFRNSIYFHSDVHVAVTGNKTDRETM